MRVTENTNFGIVRDTITRSKGRMEGLQQQHATLKKLNTPSDDPVGASKVLELRTDKVNNNQYMTNAKLAQTFLSNSEQALAELGDIIVRAKEIAIGQSSGASSNAETRLGVSEEVTQLFQQAVSIGNRRVGDRFLFGGYKTQSAPFDPDGNYKGDDGHMLVEIARDVYISMNTPGYEAFNSNPKGSPDGDRLYSDSRTIGVSNDNPEFPSESSARPANVNVFQELQNLRIGLLTGNLDGIRATLESLDQVHSKVTAERAKIGSRIQGIENATQGLERHNITNSQLSANLEDADMAQVVSDLAKEETVFRSALQSSQKLVQPTLLDFLK